MREDRVIEASEAAERIAAALPSWRIEDGQLSRTYRVHGWKSALLVTGAIGHLAEAAWHHPELTVAYGSVTVRLTTHSAGGLTEKDFALAARIEALVGWKPDGEGTLTGPPLDPRFAYVKSGG